MQDILDPRLLRRLMEPRRELGDRGEDERANVVVRIGRDKDPLHEVEDVLLANFLARSRRLVLLPTARDAAFEKDIPELTDDPDARQGEGLLRDVGAEGGVELEDGVGLEFGGVGDETDEAGEDLLANKVAGLRTSSVVLLCLRARINAPA